jgi:hypothetical protein
VTLPVTALPGASAAQRALRRRIGIIRAATSRESDDRGQYDEGSERQVPPAATRTRWVAVVRHHAVHIGSTGGAGLAATHPLGSGALRGS